MKRTGCVKKSLANRFPMKNSRQKKQRAFYLVSRHWFSDFLKPRIISIISKWVILTKKWRDFGLISLEIESVSSKKIMKTEQFFMSLKLIYLVRFDYEQISSDMIFMLHLGWEVCRKCS